MQKKELLELKRINATTKMMRMARDNKLPEPIIYKGRYGWGGAKKDTRYDMFLRCQTRGKILMIAVFFPKEMNKGIETPTYEIYCNKEGNEFLTQVRTPGEKEKWSKGKFENLKEVNKRTWTNRWYEYNEKDIRSRIWQNPEGRKTIKQFLGTEKEGWEGVIEWQKKARDKQIKLREEKEQKPWDDDMALIPPELPGFRNWAEHKACQETYIFYHYSKKVTTGYCSYCEKEVPVESPRHNQEGTCKRCGRKATFKAASKIQTLSTDQYRTECIQKIKGGIVVRRFKTQLWWRDRKPEDPHRNTYETHRVIIWDNGGSKSYEYGDYKNKMMRWVPVKGEKFVGFYGGETKLYKKNIRGLKKTSLKYSAIDLWEKLPVNAARYLLAEEGNPTVEKLARIGMFHLAKDMIFEKYDKKLLDQDADELAKMLNIDNARLKRLKGIEGGATALRWYQTEKLQDTIWPDEMIRDFEKAGFKGMHSFGFLKPPIRPVRIWNYLKKQMKLTGDTMQHINQTWYDYLNMAEKAKWNVQAEQIWKPKDLKEAHTAVILALNTEKMAEQAKKLEKKWPKVNGILPGIQKFEYRKGAYQILAPKSIMDIIREGTALNHCVHTCDFYFDRIEKNESYLFFLRKTSEPDAPWYTLEVEPSGNIRQKRTTGDNQNKDFQEAVQFLKDWQKVFVSRLTKEEKELGILADQARIREYKALRENGNKVWHGKLAGQLLADVLEQDFMEVM